jgi:hypothetical protein
MRREYNFERKKMGGSPTITLSCLVVSIAGDWPEQNRWKRGVDLLFSAKCTEATVVLSGQPGRYLGQVMMHGLWHGGFTYADGGMYLDLGGSMEIRRWDLYNSKS